MDTGTVLMGTCLPGFHLILRPPVSWHESLYGISMASYYEGWLRVTLTLCISLRKETMLSRVHSSRTASQADDTRLKLHSLSGWISKCWYDFPMEQKQNLKDKKSSMKQLLFLAHLYKGQRSTGSLFLSFCAILECLILKIHGNLKEHLKCQSIAWQSQADEKRVNVHLSLTAHQANTVTACSFLYYSCKWKREKPFL